MNAPNPFERGRKRGEIIADILVIAGESYPFFGLLSELEAAMERDVLAALDLPCVGCGEPTRSRTDDGTPKHVGCPGSEA